MTTSDKKKKSSRRNFLKARLSSITFDFTILSEAEKEDAYLILNAKEKLLKNWDNNTAVLLGKDLPKFKCCKCSRRLNAEYRIYGETFCYKHYKILSEFSL